MTLAPSTVYLTGGLFPGHRTSLSEAQKGHIHGLHSAITWADSEPFVNSEMEQASTLGRGHLGLAGFTT